MSEKNKHRAVVYSIMEMLDNGLLTNQEAVTFLIETEGYSMGGSENNFKIVRDLLDKLAVEKDNVVAHTNAIKAYQKALCEEREKLKEAEEQLEEERKKNREQARRITISVNPWSDIGYEELADKVYRLYKQNKSNIT